MTFPLTAEQRDFAAVLHGLLAGADVPSAARAWAAGDRGPGLAIWRALARAGVTGLVIPESSGGLGASPADLVVACEELGHHPVPGPLAESLAAIPALLASLPLADPKTAGWLGGLASGDLIATLALPPLLLFALDADVAGLVLYSEAGGTEVRTAAPGTRLASADRARHPHEVVPGELVAGQAGHAVARGIAFGTLASAALLAGAGRGLLDAAVAHAKTREQFGLADRLVPGGQARARRRSDRAGVRQAAAVRSGGRPRRRRRDRGPRRRRGPGRLRRRGPPGRAHRAAGARGDRLHARVRRQPVAGQGAGAVGVLGQPGSSPGRRPGRPRDQRGGPLDLTCADRGRAHASAAPVTRDQRDAARCWP